MNNIFYDRTNDAGSGAFFDRTNDAPMAPVSGVTDAESVPSAIGTGYKVVVFQPTFNFGTGSLFAPFRYTGVPNAGDTCRYPDVNGLVIDPDGRLHANTNNINVTCYYNDGSGEQPFNLIIDNSANAIVRSVTDAESVSTVTASGSSPGSASVAGVTDAESVPSATAIGGGSGSPQGVVDAESVPGAIAGGAASAAPQGVTDTETVPTVSGDGPSNALPQGVNDAESVPSAVGAGAASATPQGVNEQEQVQPISAGGAASAQPQGVDDVESVPTASVQFGAEVSGVNDQETVPTVQPVSGGSASVSGVDDQETIAKATAAEVPESVYAKPSNMITRFGSTEIIQLTDKENTGSIDASVLSQALADTDAEIDGYLEGRYKLPLAIVPRVLITYACDIARYRLYDDRATDQATKRYEAAIKFLTMVAKRQINLGVEADLEPSVQSAGGPSSSSSTRVFTDDSLGGFVGES